MHRQEDTTGCQTRLCAEEAVAGRHEQILTEDGSVTLCVPELHEHYHSVHGAIQEARHIFLRAGMDDYLAARADAARSTMPLHILEAGFGTGLNAYLTLLHAEEMQTPVCYHSLEKYPLQPEEVATLNYTEQTGRGNDPLFRALHEAAWEEDVEVTPRFRLHKHRCDFRETDFPPMFDLVFYDAFNPEAQPHLWTEEVFARFHRALLPDGKLVTYCVKGTVKRALRSVGFTLERLPGPPGKREMLRAGKKNSTFE